MRIRDPHVRVIKGNLVPRGGVVLIKDDQEVYVGPLEEPIIENIDFDIVLLSPADYEEFKLTLPP